MDATSLSNFKVLPFSVEYIDIDDDKPMSPFEDSLSLKASSSWSYCGPLLSVFPDLLPSSFHSWVKVTINGKLDEPFVSFLKYVHGFLEANNIYNYWITIRATQGTREFDVPRWHTDNLFFTPLPSQRRRSFSSTLPTIIKIGRGKTSHRQKAHHRNLSSAKNTPGVSHARVTDTHGNPPNWKLSTTLLGPGTLFIGPKNSPLARRIEQDAKRTVRDSRPDHMCSSVRCLGCSAAAESVRLRLADELSQCDIVQAQRGECTFFKVGEDQGAVHSEPMSHGDRIFINVVPSHEADLRNLMARWGMEYPRAWCVEMTAYQKLFN